MAKNIPGTDINYYANWTLAELKAERQRRKKSKRVRRTQNKTPRSRVHTLAEKLDFAAAMRANPTPIERTLDRILQKLIGKDYEIKRQFVQGGYILDFYVPELRLCFEADGRQHNARADAIRDSRIAKYGIRTVRLTGTQLRFQEPAVEAKISLAIETAESRFSGGRFTFHLFT